jgi:hypothetical protein
MTKELDSSSNPLTQYRISPEIFEVATEYVKHLNVKDTAKALDLTPDIVAGIIEKKEVKRYIDTIFLEQGYMQRNKLNDVMSDLIDMKLEEMQETGLGSNKDILDILKLAHDMRKDHAKAEKDEVPGQQVNIQNNFGGDNYNSLLENIMKGSV